MKYLFILFLSISLSWGMHQPQNRMNAHHAFPAANCTGCIIRFLMEGKPFEAYQLLNKFNAEIYEISVPQAEQGSLLHHYVMQAECQPFFFKMLLAKGAKLDLLNGQGETPLIVALRVQNYFAARMLIRAKADVTVVSANLERTALHWLCVGTSFLEAFNQRTVARKGMDPFRLARSLIATRPHTLKERCLQRVVELKLNHRVIPVLHADALFTLLAQSRIFNLQLINTEDIALSLKLRLLAGTARDEMVNKQDSSGDTALHLAARLHAHSDFAFFLVSLGADRLIINRAGHTPYDVAKISPCQKKICRSCVELQDYLQQPLKVLQKIEEVLNAKKGSR